MYYAAAEIREKPELKDVPLAVGDEFSIVTTANYVARKFGVRSAMPGFVARALCPQIVFVPCNYRLYTEIS